MAEGIGEILIADMSRCEPGECLSRKGNQQGAWLLYDYETDRSRGPHIRGTMAYGCGRLDSPPLALPLDVPEGWYNIYIGAWHDIHVGGSHLRLRLAQDRFYRQLGPEACLPKDGDFPGHQFGPGDLTESFWRVARLQGERLIIDRVRPWTYITVTSKVSDPAACLAYVRLTPATKADQDVYFGRGRTRTPRPLFAQYDNGNWWQVGCRSEYDIRASLDWFRDTDQNRINWGCFSGEGCCYPSRVGQQMGREPEVTRCLAEFFKRGVDPLRIASEHAREIGIGLYPSFRIGGKRPAPAHPTTNEMPFFDSHQHCLCVAPDGRPTPHYSFAYEEVRQYFVDVIREVVEEYDVPGINFIFARSQPFVLYEEKTVREFRERHGVHPRELPDDDPRWLEHRAGYLTAFVKQMRAALDQVGREKGRRAELVATVPSNLRLGVDWAVDGVRWATEGLADYLILHSGGVTSTEDVRAYRQALAGSGVPIIVDFYPRRMPARERMLRAIEYYEAGADGFCFWDSQGRVTRAAEFAFARWLGHDEDLGDWARQMAPSFRVLPLSTLQGYSMDRRFWTLTSG